MRSSTPPTTPCAAEVASTVRSTGPEAAAILEDCIARFPQVSRPATPAGPPAGNLPARWVIHVVGPNRHAGQTDRALLLSCYSRALEVADELGARTVAFPLVSAGVYGWPKDDAIAAPLEVFAAADAEVEEARLVAFDHATYEQIQEQVRAAR